MVIIITAAGMMLRSPIFQCHHVLSPFYCHHKFHLIAALLHRFLRVHETFCCILCWIIYWILLFLVGKAKIKEKVISF